ncbi:hypothetical protein ACQPXH_10225 [Nocardia sp. CA-135953]|uniref:nucleotide-binding protein n=1 Tax=Nocardia sp. CA-135953 TaxID=3239978 RepID=UPI003D963516
MLFGEAQVCARAPAALSRTSARSGARAGWRLSAWISTPSSPRAHAGWPGGPGKTALVNGLAHAAAARDEDVLVGDVDPQGTTTAHFTGHNARDGPGLVMRRGPGPGGARNRGGRFRTGPRCGSLRGG